MEGIIPTDPEALMALIYSFIGPFIISLLKNFDSRQKTMANIVLAIVAYMIVGFFLFTDVPPAELVAWALAAAGLSSGVYAVATKAKDKLGNGKKK